MKRSGIQMPLYHETNVELPRMRCIQMQCFRETNILTEARSELQHIRMLKVSDHPGGGAPVAILRRAVLCP